MLGSGLAFNVAGPWFISFLSLILSLVTVLKDNGQSFLIDETFLFLISARGSSVSEINLEIDCFSYLAN